MICRQKLAAVFGVLEALQATADNSEEFGEEVANAAADIFTSLKFTRNAAFKSKKVVQHCVEKVAVTEEFPDDEGLFGALDTSNHSDKGHRFLKFNSKAKTITIQVTGLTTQVNSIQIKFCFLMMSFIFGHIRDSISASKFV